jgi:hypothetical protein
MNKYLIITIILVFLVFMEGFLNRIDKNQNDSVLYAPGNILKNEYSSPDTTPPANFPFQTIINFDYQNISGMNNGTVGALYLFGKYYFNCWNSNNCYIWDNSGTNGGPGNMRAITYFGGMRDLATDGRYIYGGTAANILYKMDTNMVTLSQWTIGGGSFRALAWDPGRKAFWNSNYAGPITCYDTNGVLKASISNSLLGKYGIAFDSLLQNDTAYLWVWNQESDYLHNTLNKFRINTGELIASYLFTLPGAQTGVAGGAEICIYPGDPPKEMILLNYQNFALVVYKMKDLITALENNNEIVYDFRLSQNFPNPFNPTTQIEFHLMKTSHVSLIVYDMLGNKIKTLIEGKEEAGRHTLTFDASKLSSGVYFYSIAAEVAESNSGKVFHDSKKMLLVK